MTNLDYFIDTHCHMFTIADIPLYEMVRQLAEDNDAPGKTILYGIVAGFLNLDGKAKEYEKFIRFFENEPSDSVKQICDEITALVNAKGCDSYRFTAAHTITTPMIMDMDLGGNIDKEKKSKVDGQTKRLRDAIAHVKPAVKVLPFVGIDLGRDKKDFAKRLSQIKSIKERGGIAKTHSGDLIGLKLYPALGFEPDKHIDKLKKVVERDIPVTAHCQKGGPKMHDNIDIFTDPENWADVLEKCPQLRINLAHFGGEDGAIDAIDYIFDDTETYPWNTFNGLADKSWTLTIIEILKKYPNTYADISAFDFDDEKAVCSLRWIIQSEIDGKFAGEFSLFDKLLWGSDYPMPLNEKNKNYSRMFKKFIRGLKGTYTDECEFPPAFEETFVDGLIEKMICINSKTFLGIV